MKDPTILVTHHGSENRLLTLQEMRRIYQDTHYVNLYQRYDQPRSSSAEYPDIAYHILVGTDGWCWARDLDIEGYHASHYPTNLDSIAICLTGNYNKMTLSPEMEGHYRAAVKAARKKVPSLVTPQGHRKTARKLCPGKNITDKFLKESFKTAGKTKADMLIEIAKLQKLVGLLTKLAALFKKRK
jgi:hypothetical protein